MAKSTALAQINKSFEKQVQRLAEEGAEIVSSYVDLTARMLSFAADFKAASDTARKLYKSDNGLHSKLLKDTLAKTIQTSNPSIWSRWNTIVTYSKNLLAYKNAIPSQRDSLYELALAVKENKPIQKWIDAEKITVESSVREVRALRENKKTSKSKNVKASRNFSAVATLCFRSYDEAAETLLSTITDSNNLEVRSPKAFREAIKAKVGIDGFEKIKNRFKD